MAARQLLHPGTIAFRPRTTVSPVGRTDMLLLIAVICAFVLVSGHWVRESLAGPVAPVMATITVQPGDTLWSLAKKYGDPNQYILVRMDLLAQANSLRRGDVLRAGQTLTIPVTNRNCKLYYGGDVCKEMEAQRRR